MNPTVTVIGEGAWGTAVATLLARNGCTVLLWCHDKSIKEEIEKSGFNERYLPGVKLSHTIIPTLNLDESFEKSGWIFEAIPVKYLRSVIFTVDRQTCVQKPWVILSKGIEVKTNMLPSEIIDSELQSMVPKVVLFGPSFAHDLARRQVTGFTAASSDFALSTSLKDLLVNDYCKVSLSNDVIGVQLCGALKNIIALLVGILDGAGYGDNTKAFIITQGLSEIATLIRICGGLQETVYGLAGVGDLLLTSMGKHSRNVRTGQLIGRGTSLDTILQETGMIPEGITTLISIHEFIQKKHVMLPFFESVYHIVYGNLTLQNFLQKI